MNTHRSTAKRLATHTAEGLTLAAALAGAGYGIDAIVVDHTWLAVVPYLICVAGAMRLLDDILGRRILARHRRQVEDARADRRAEAAARRAALGFVVAPATIRKEIRP